MKQFFVFIHSALLLGLAFTVFAADEDPAITSFKSTTLEMVGKVSNAGVSLEEKRKLSDQYLKSNADCEYMGKFALGRHFLTLSPENQKAYLQAFTDFFAATWDPRFAPFAGQICKFTKTSLLNNIFIVESTMEGGGKPSRKVLWKIKKSGETMKLQDLTIEGISVLVSLRSEFASIIVSNGGKVEQLIQQLVARK